MLTYGRASTITGPKETLFGGVGATEGSRSDRSGQGEAGVNMTGQGWVGAGEDGPRVEEEGADTEGRDTESSGSKVGGDEGVFKRDAGLAVEAGWVVSCIRNT